jgi:hypothetical protein
MQMAEWIDRRSDRLENSFGFCLVASGGEIEREMGITFNVSDVWRRENGELLGLEVEMKIRKRRNRKMKRRKSTEGNREIYGSCTFCTVFE